MNKLIKTSTLLALLLLFSSVAFAGGWQKNLGETIDIYEHGGMKHTTDNYLPTKDGGILVYGSYSTPDIIGYLIKIDKYGNIQWHKDVIKSNTSFLSDTTYYYHEGGIQSVVETENGDFILMHNGPTFYVEPLTFLYDHKKISYFTRINNYGAIISTKFDLTDSVTLDRFGYPYFTASKFDINTNTYAVYSVIHSNYETKSKLVIKSYDSAFNVLNSRYIDIDSSYDLSYIDVKDSTIFLSNQGQQEITQLYCTDLQGNDKFKTHFAFDSIVKYTIDSIKQLHPSCVCNISNGNENGYNFKDYFFDEHNNLHLFSLITADQEAITFGDTTCKRNGAYYYLSEFILDIHGHVVQVHTLDVSAIFTTFSNQGIVNLIAMPQYNSFINLLLLPASVKFEKYYFIQYDSQNNSIVKKNVFSNLTDTRSLNLLSENSVFPIKRKSAINNNYYCALNYSTRTNAYEIGLILYSDTLGSIFTHIIQGNVFADQNGNCIKNATDKNLPQVTVKAVRDNNNTAYTSSDNNGNYSIGVGDSGLYTVTAQPNINYPLFAQSSCPVQTSYAYLDSFTIDTINLNLKPTILCPNMYVDISTPMLRRCFSNIYTVNYKNNGTIASPNTFINVALDRFLTVNSASIPYTNLGNNVLRFNIGNVDYLSSGRFTIDVTVRCDSTIVGQTHCVEAHIYPDTVCAVASYTGPVISTTAICKHDSVEFKIRNSGGNMSQRKRYIVIEDNVNRLNGTFQLNTGQQQLVTIAADTGRTYGIIAEQDALFPSQLGDAYASAFIEGCNPVSGTFTTGIITQYPEFDGEPYRSVDCQQNRGSFDPNDKTGYPIGVSGNHNIEKNTAIDYKINFQNTGNDTAFKVVIVDTISKFLDINTIEPGASSHRYTFMRTDSNTIKFIFDSIKLVDSNKNEKLSHGFVKFRIQQKANNPNGTKIYNTAEIYFDYNSPIFTNKTMHTIGDVYVRIISKVINPTYAKADIKIYPNPFRDKTTIELQNMELQKTSLILIDITGKEILQQSSINNQYEINGGDLAKGFYLFQIKNDKGEIANGKLIVQ